MILKFKILITVLLSFIGVSIPVENLKINYATAIEYNVIKLHDGSEFEFDTDEGYKVGQKVIAVFDNMGTKSVKDDLLEFIVQVK